MESLLCISSSIVYRYIVNIVFVMWFSSDSLIVYVLHVYSPYSNGCVRSNIQDVSMLRFNNGLSYFAHYSIPDKFLKDNRCFAITTSFQRVTFPCSDCEITFSISISKKIHYIYKRTSAFHHDTKYLRNTLSLLQT